MPQLSSFVLIREEFSGFVLIRENSNSNLDITVACNGFNKASRLVFLKFSLELTHSCYFKNQ